MVNGMEKTLELCCELIRRQSVTPQDAGCQDLMMQRLAALGFACTPLPFEDVDNFWAERGSEGPILVFAGHTDVVPAGPPDDWDSPPFEPTLIDGRLETVAVHVGTRAPLRARLRAGGRGAADSSSPAAS